MHAWQFDHYGHYSENLHWVERPTPTPGFGEALVRTRAVSLNFPDLLIVQGMYQHKAPLPAVPGVEGVGVVESVGPGSKFKVGDRAVGFCHGGGTLAQLLPRLQHAWACFPALQAAMPTAPREAARTLYYDDLVYDSTTIAYLLQTFGPTQLMLGSDYPFAIMDPDPVGRLAALTLDEPVRALLRHGNATRWLGLEARHEG